MAPRRSRQAQAQEPSATIDWLSDDLLAKCFSLLDQEERLSRAALVSRRWYAVSNRHELQREVLFEDGRIVCGVIPAAQSLLRWMQRHGPAVRSLEVTLEDLWADEEAEVMSLLHKWLALCSGRLEKLIVSLDGELDFTVVGAIASAPRLQDFRILGVDRLHIPVTLSGMTALQCLELGANEWLGKRVQLPVSLTRLGISRHRVGRLPSQVAALTNLRGLRLSQVSYSAGGMASLARLSSLEHLSFRFGREIPGSLQSLSGLQMLEIYYPNYEDGSFTTSLDNAFRQLNQLTGLYLNGLPADLALPPSLAALARLEWFYYRPAFTPQGQAAEVVLTVGPWQRSLCHLVTPFPLAQLNLSFLSGAERLQRLSILEPPQMQPGAEELWQAFWRWTAQHEPLQRLDVQKHTSATNQPDIWLLLSKLLELKERRPALLIDTQLEPYSSLHDELFGDWQ